MNVSHKLHLTPFCFRTRCGQAGLGLLAALLLWGSHGSASYAQRLDPNQLQQFLSSPLVDRPRDPALPQPEVDRSLSPLELYQLGETLDNLDARAQALLDSEEEGATDEAFELWLREVRLRRVLGLEAELTALERVIPVVWNNQRGPELQLLTQRLRVIWNNATQSEAIAVDVERLLALFIMVRDEAAVIDITQGLADQAAARGDGVTQRQHLADLGAAYLAWFEFDKAAGVYESLVADAAIRNSPAQERTLLAQLIYSYQQNDRYAAAIPHQQRLLGLYRAADLADAEVPVGIAIARNYRAVADYPRAVEYYQLAYRTAQQLQQYGYSSEVLQDLGDLYRDLGQLRDAITIYNLLVRVEQQSYNHYGILLAYDELGQIYTALNELDNARVAFQAGLAFAEALDYRQEYFQAQLAALE
ncbi:MAG: hypothetical protein AAFU71_14905 [Cyanobacteria bacterium J06632_22]